MTLENYLPILLFISTAILLGLGLLLIGSFLGPKIPYVEKLTPYECGFETFEDARSKFDVRYHLVAILFILFDLEIAFLFPWAVVQGSIPPASFWTLIVFLSILASGFIYEWQKGALNWE